MVAPEKGQVGCLSPETVIPAKAGIRRRARPKVKLEKRGVMVEGIQ